ncbi:MAG: nucleoside 2-deoxyribosyltransferase, partial [Actinomycetota bacterium]|nr:nucleoside 2-deoxyribosyltransferase [Actinomycetota bacterium]
MRVFVSGKVGDEERVRDLINHLTALGHDVTFDWTAVPHLKPYERNHAASARTAALEVDGVKQSDIVIVLAHEDGIGMYVELGIALGTGKQVYIVSKGSSRSMFFHHPLVTIVNSIDDVLTRLNG